MSSVTQQQKPRTYRKDYKRPPFIVKDAHITFDLDFTNTKVTTHMNVERKDPNASVVVLNGEELDLKEIKMNGKVLLEGTDYTLGEVAGEPQSITIKDITQDCLEFQIVQCVNPTTNTMLSGVYKSDDVLISFNEPHGMRRICYWIDRPDNMTIYTVTLTGDKSTFPVLLSNGDRTEYTELEGGQRHTATFKDPWPKGPHLFAICAGKLGSLTGTFRTMEGRNVSLEIYAEQQYVNQLDWALEVTKQAFKFDEERYGRCYDLDVFRVVGVSNFNMGAMENKSLCVFNISALVASPKQSADRNYNRVLTVIGHEYFHNWSGNRVNVRDWFQITLKEGFTRYREAEFEAWYYGEGVSLLGRVNGLRGRQFAEDAGPNAHPIRPESYIDVDNFYTATIYVKGAAVIGMYKALLGPEGYRKGTDHYFSTYDGQAVSCDEFRNAMGTANGRDLSQFELWYKQRRTPHIQVVSRNYSAENKRYTITLKQIVAADADPNGGEPQAYLIPVLFGLVGKKSGRDLIGTKCLELDKWEKTFEIENVEEDCVPSVLRQYCAPVILEPFLEEDEVFHIMSYDADDFNRWEAGRSLVTQEILRRLHNPAKGLNSPLPMNLKKALSAILSRATKVEEYGMVAECLKMPATNDICNQHPGLDPYMLATAIDDLRKAIGKELSGELKSLYEKVLAEMPSLGSDKLDTSAGGVDKRSLACVLLSLLATTEDHKEKERLVMEGYFKRSTMTEKETAVMIAAGMNDCEVRDKVLQAHYEHCKGCDENTLDSWFIVQASARGPLVTDRIVQLAEHPDYRDSTNPNRIRALLTQCLTNYSALLHPSNKGLDWVAKSIKRLDGFNPRVAAVQSKLLAAFSNYDTATIERMRAACAKIYDGGKCSFSVKEILEPAVKC